MRMTRTIVATVAANLGATTRERISVVVGAGRNGHGYRVTLAVSPTARQLTWDSARNEGRQAVAYMLGALDAYTDGEAFDRTPFLADARRALAYRDELEGALRMGREDGERARAVPPSGIGTGRVENRSTCKHCAQVITKYGAEWWTSNDDFMCADGETAHTPR